MDFEFIEPVSYPVEAVAYTLRDRLGELAKFLPEIDDIELVDRTVHSTDRLSIINLWQGNQQSAPKGVRPFVSRKMLAWRDVAEWYGDPLRVEWRFETLHFESLFTCSGVNYFEPTTDLSAQIRLTGQLQVYPERVPGVPKFLAKRMGPTIEKWLINMITPNLKQLPRAIQALLDADGNPAG